MSMAHARESEFRMARRSPRYHGPLEAHTASLMQIVHESGRMSLRDDQLDMLRPTKTGSRRTDILVHYAGDLGILRNPCVSIVGTREVTEIGRRRTAKLARELAQENVIVVSGLAKGVDTVALTTALECGGKTCAVIGTPLEKAYPAENARLQEQIWEDHLLVSPFGSGEAVFKSNFPKRNRVMAAVSDATVIVEASDTSGTLHQAAECQRLGRWLFIMKSLVENPLLSWPKSFVGKPKTVVLESTSQILEAIV